MFLCVKTLVQVKNYDEETQRTLWCQVVCLSKCVLVRVDGRSCFKAGRGGSRPILGQVRPPLGTLLL